MYLFSVSLRWVEKRNLKSQAPNSREEKSEVSFGGVPEIFPLGISL